MKRFTESGRAAIANKNHYAALSVALTLPDICASLEDPGPSKTHSRYVAWFKKWAAKHFGEYLSAEDCFQLRCSLIHSGSADIEETKRAGVDKFEFLADDNAPHLIVQRGNKIDGVLQPSVTILNTKLFCEAIYESAEAWDASIIDNAKMQEAKKSLIVIKDHGAVLQLVQI